MDLELGDTRLGDLGIKRELRRHQTPVQLRFFGITGFPARASFTELYLECKV